MTRTETEQLLELAAAAEARARTEAERWNVARRDLNARAGAIVADLATVGEQLRAGRMAELQGGEVPGLADLAMRERELQAEQTEVSARLEIAESEQARTHGIFQAAAEASGNASIAAQHEAAIARAGVLDEEIDAAYARLIELLNERGEIADGSARMARLGYGGEIGFSWQRLPHGGLRSNRIGFPGAA